MKSHNRILFFAYAVALPASPSAHALQTVAISNVKAGMLASMCADSKDALAMDPCNSFIIGAADALQFGQKVCIKETSGYPYVVTGVVKKQLVDHPEDWGQPAATVVWKALLTKFPCR